MTDFKEELSRIVNRIDGCIGAVIIGSDGLVISQYIKGQGALDISSVNIELVSIIRKIHQIMEEIGFGGFVEISLTCEKVHVVMRALNKDYFISILMLPGSNTAKGRFIMRTAGMRLAREF